jgi:hypothetical protein
LLEEPFKFLVELLGPTMPSKSWRSPVSLVVIEKRSGALVVVGEADLEALLVIVLPLNEGLPQRSQIPSFFGFMETTL